MGHTAKKISSLCSIFLRQGDTILCEVNRHRCYSSDLLQEGLEVPCILTFVAAEEKEKAKTLRIFELVLGTYEAKRKCRIRMYYSHSNL